MAWHPNDLVTDADLVAYERNILTGFGTDDWQTRRQKALEDWLFPLLESRGYNPHRFRTRYLVTHAIGETSSTFSDLTDEAQDSDGDGLVLSTILAASTDRLYIGSEQPFRGLSVRMLDDVNAVAATLTVKLWADTWATALNLSNGTIVGTAPFGQGGAVTWRLPEGLTRRKVNATGPAYWARLALSATPTSGTAIGAVHVIRRSRLCAPVALRTLALIFREAPTSSEGPWVEKAEWYEREADRAWSRVSEQIGGEFDTDDDDAISATEQDQTAADATGGGWRWERA